MRRRIDKRALFAAAVTVAAITIWSSSTRAPDRADYSGRLVSVKDLQTDYGDMCYAERIDPFALDAVAPEGNLFAAFDDTAHAAAQSTGSTTDLSRPPVRTIRDTYPIYSSIAIAQFNEVGRAESVRHQGVQSPENTAGVDGDAGADEDATDSNRTTASTSIRRTATSIHARHHYNMIVHARCERHTPLIRQLDAASTSPSR
jgi:hypothetical protein